VLQTIQAGFWIRTLAVLLDGALISLVCGGLWFATGSFLDDEQRLTLLSAASLALNVAVNLVGWSVWGTTPGKRLLGLYVFRAGSETPGIGFLKGALRVVGYWVSGALLGIGFLMVAFTKGKRGLHDKIAGTSVGRVVKK
jgi:uncharacterized RDD family membrane protein YckC